MSEQTKNDRNDEPGGADRRPPRYAFRLEDLRPWHIVQAWCVPCNRKVVLNHQVLWRGRSRHTLLADLERRLRCTHCGSRSGHRLDVHMAPRN